MTRERPPKSAPPPAAASVSAPVSAFAPDEGALDAIGRRLAVALRPGDVVCLDGALGAGKSTLARSVVAARLAGDVAAAGAETTDAADFEIPSPTYTLVQSYETRGGPVRHADLYRLSAAEEAFELDLFEEDGAVVLIEWAERLGALAPARRLELRLEIPEDGAGRRLSVQAVGSGWEAAIAAIRPKG